MQTTGFTPVQTPVWHVSVCVHAFPSSQVEPSALGFGAQAPVVGLQAPTLQSSVSPLQSLGVPFWHVPALRSQVSIPSQSLPLSHSAFVVHLHAVESVVHPPAISEQLSMVHARPSLHVIGAPLHVPALQVSDAVHARPSSQVVPSASGGSSHWPVCGSHTPAA
jgi:hypothetical protein